MKEMKIGKYLYYWKMVEFLLTQARTSAYVGALTSVLRLVKFVVRESRTRGGCARCESIVASGWDKTTEGEMSELHEELRVLVNNQVGGPCGELEMKWINCVEAYGEDMGARKCKDYVSDLYQCMTRTLEMYRVIAMREERERQIKLGIRSEQFIDGPAHDSYQYPTMMK